MVVSNSCWALLMHVLVVVHAFAFCSGAKDIYHNSFISPNSANDNFDASEESAIRTSGPGEIPESTVTIGTNKNDVIKIDNDDGDINDGIAKGSSVLDVLDKSVEAVPYASSVHNLVERSADPILAPRTSGVDNLALYKNVGDALEGNDVELSGRIGSYITPSKTDKQASENDVKPTLIASPSGEDRGAPQARSLPLPEPQEITPTATMTTLNFASLSAEHGRGRQANPDIQDIITGIVKLLNGNVNVQANTGPGGIGRPLRPLSTRINNRGPPRITDVPALPPDFDIPAPPLPPPPMGQMPPPMSTRLPTPYPFDMPNMSPKRPYIGVSSGSSIPLSDQVIPGSKRPGFYRPVTIPPWNRHRRPSKRPHIPVYKPLPPLASDMISITSEQPMEDILTLDLGTQLQNHDEVEHEVKNEEEEDGGLQEDEKKGNVTSDEVPVKEVTTDVFLETSEPSMDEELSEFEKNKEKNPKPEKSSKTTLVTPTVPKDTSLLEPLTTSQAPSEDVTSPTSSYFTSESSSTTAGDIAPTNVSKEILPTFTSLTNASNIEVLNNATSVEESLASPILESSIQDALQTLREELIGSSSTVSTAPTETLPEISETLSSESNTEGIAVKDTSTSLVTNHSSETTTSTSGFPYFSYRPRPGIVLDDTEYKPGGINRQPVVTRPPIGAIGDIFDITVSAIQGPGGASAGQGQPYVIPVDIENIHGGSTSDVITSPVGDEGFVSIDGKRTYLNLFGENPTPTTSVGSIVKPSSPSNNQVIGTGYAVVEQEKPNKAHSVGSVKPTQRRPGFGRPRPSQPPVRIDTCIVGDDSTCDGSQHEVCKTESGVSACHCRPGTARRKHRDPCRKIVSVILSLRVDRLYERRVVWANELLEKSSESYQQLSYEAERALESAMSMTPFSDEYLGSKVNNIYRGDRSQGQAGVFVNITLQLEENADTARPSVRGDIQRHLLGVIQRRSNNVGNSALWVDSPPGAVSSLQDLDECSSPELHDCHSLAKCINVFGGFKCECGEGYRDPWVDNKHRAGRQCEQCPSQHCSNRGECKYQNGQEVCICSGNYYGNQCELDGEVLGVAIGASVAAVIIIGLTLVCLVMWSRRWSREQKAAVGSPVFGYMATASNTVKTPVVGAPPYQLTLEDRLRWAQIADVMAQSNHYAPEPGLTAPTRPSSAMFGYPNLAFTGTLQHPASIGGTLPPVPLPRLNLHAQLASRAASIHGMRPLDNSSSSEEEDKADLLGRNFQVPRPKSRSNASVANQSGIYYDVDYDQNEVYKQPGGIPMSTYGRAPFFRN